MKKKCAIEALNKSLKNQDKKWYQIRNSIENDIRKEIKEAFNFAIKSKLPAKKDSWKFIYA